MKWKIRDIEIENQVVIGPMAGISNVAFRTIAKEFKAGLVYTEMLSDKAIVYENQKTKGMADIDESEHPLAMQLFGSDIESMVEAAIFMDTQTTCDIIDINMGCPVTKVVKSGSGSALMKTPELAFKIVQSVVQAVKKPVTVKMRIGWDSHTINAVEFAKGLEEAGANAIAVHARTRSQMYEGKSDWSYIKAVKEAVSIPVIGNGDIHSVIDAKRMLDETGCDAVMIARGVLGDPWLIAEIVEYLETGIPLPKKSFKEKILVSMEHAKRLIALKGESIGMKEMRGHASWYITGMPYNNRLKEILNQISSMEEYKYLMNQYCLLLEQEEIHKEDVDDMLQSFHNNFHK